MQETEVPGDDDMPEVVVPAAVGRSTTLHVTAVAAERVGDCRVQHDVPLRVVFDGEWTEERERSSRCGVSWETLAGLFASEPMATERAGYMLLSEAFKRCGREWKCSVTMPERELLQRCDIPTNMVRVGGSYGRRCSRQCGASSRGQSLCVCSTRNLERSPPHAKEFWSKLPKECQKRYVAHVRKVEDAHDLNKGLQAELRTLSRRLCVLEAAGFLDDLFEDLKPRYPNLEEYDTAGKLERILEQQESNDKFRMTLFLPQNDAAGHVAARIHDLLRGYGKGVHEEFREVATLLEKIAKVDRRHQEEAPEGFVTETFPFYLEALATQGHSYYLTPEEVLATAEAIHANVIITRKRDGEEHYHVIGHHLGCDGEIAVLVLHGEGRGHFERLCSMAAVQKRKAEVELERKRKRDAAERERKRKHAEEQERERDAAERERKRKHAEEQETRRREEEQRKEEAIRLQEAAAAEEQEEGDDVQKAAGLSKPENEKKRGAAARVDLGELTGDEEEALPHVDEDGNGIAAPTEAAVPKEEEDADGVHKAAGSSKPDDGKKPRAAARFDFGGLSGDEEEALPHVDEAEARGRTNRKIRTLQDVLGHSGRLGEGSEASEADSQAGKLSESEMESDLEDEFHVSLLPAEQRQWETEEDSEIERVRRLARHLREQPHLPADFRDPTRESTLRDRKLLDGYIALPYAHCVFKGCGWIQAEPGEGRRPPEYYLLLHVRQKHKEIFRECCGEHCVDKDQEQYLDYLEEAMHHKAESAPEMPEVGASVDRRTMDTPTHGHGE